MNDDSDIQKGLVDKQAKFNTLANSITEGIESLIQYLEVLEECKAKMGTTGDTKTMRTRMKNEIAEANDLIKTLLDQFQELEDVKFKNRKENDNKNKMLRRLNNTFEEYYDKFTKAIKEIANSEKKFMDIKQTVFNASSISEMTQSGILHNEANAQQRQSLKDSVKKSTHQEEAHGHYENQSHQQNPEYQEQHQEQYEHYQHENAVEKNNEHYQSTHEHQDTYHTTESHENHQGYNQGYEGEQYHQQHQQQYEGQYEQGGYQENYTEQQQHYQGENQGHYDQYDQQHQGYQNQEGHYQHQEQQGQGYDDNYQRRSVQGGSVHQHNDNISEQGHEEPKKAFGVKLHQSFNPNTIRDSSFRVSVQNLKDLKESIKESTNNLEFYESIIKQRESQIGELKKIGSVINPPEDSKTEKLDESHSERDFEEEQNEVRIGVDESSNAGNMGLNASDVKTKKKEPRNNAVINKILIALIALVVIGLVVVFALL